MIVREKLVKLFEDFLLEKGASPKDLEFLKSLPLEVRLIRMI